MMPSTSPSSVGLSHLTLPVVTGLISVIVNYGGTFILVFQAAKVAGHRPELTASSGWAISIGVRVTGLFLSRVSGAPIITAWPMLAAAFPVTVSATTPFAVLDGLLPQCAPRQAIAPTPDPVVSRGAAN